MPSGEQIKDGLYLLWYQGVDIKRLRVLVYLPNAQTEFFRQAIVGL